MRIHLVTDEFNLGGGIEHIFQVAKGLNEIEIHVYAQKGKGDAIEKFNQLENVTLHQDGYEPSLVLEGNPDLVHIHHLRPLFAFFKKPFCKYNVPIVFTAHGLHIHKYEFFHTAKSKIAYLFRFQLEKWLYGKVDKIIAVSREDRDYLADKYHVGKAVYLTNGIDIEAITAGKHQKKEEIRRKLGLPADEYLFVTVARFNFQKGYDILLQGIKQARQEIKKKRARFIFVGDGEEFEAMQALAAYLEVSQHIIFLGARNDVYEILKAADVFLLTSRWEGLPIVLLETGLLRLPVVASDTYGNREIIGKKNGVLFKNLEVDDLTEAIRQVLEGKYNLEKCAENLYREVLENYGLERMLAGLRKIYKELI